MFDITTFDIFLLYRTMASTNKEQAYDYEKYQFGAWLYIPRKKRPERIYIQDLDILQNKSEGHVFGYPNDVDIRHTSCSRGRNKFTPSEVEEHAWSLRLSKNLPALPADESED